MTSALILGLAGLHVATHELLLIVATGIAVTSLDDSMVDLVYFIRRGWRSITVYRRHRRVLVEDLPVGELGWMAIIVPAWDEAAVIGAMLRDLTTRLAYANYRVFVGIYPNDPATAAAVTAVDDRRIVLVHCSRPGPTTKADCLNHLWRAVLADELASARRFKAIVLHDAEDVVHARELAVFDHLIPRLALVQLPVAPLVDRSSRWISGHYLDEFAEAHAKDLVVREAIGAAVPSAGVACAIARDMLATVAGGGDPFDASCMTEDYELGIRIKALGGRGALVRLRSGNDRELVATREHFPATLDAALRQKTRWLTGIALSGWDRLSWPGGWADRYMLMRDRKAIVAALLALAGYLTTALVLVDVALTVVVPAARSFSPLVPAGSVLAGLLWINAIALGWRVGLRAAFSTSAHGWREGVRAIPRVVVGNLINAAAALRALRSYRRIITGRAIPVWDKTVHKFPGA